MGRKKSEEFAENLNFHIIIYTIIDCKHEISGEESEMYTDDYKFI